MLFLVTVEEIMRKKHFAHSVGKQNDICLQYHVSYITNTLVHAWLTCLQQTCLYVYVSLILLEIYVVLNFINRNL